MIRTIHAMMQRQGVDGKEDGEKSIMIEQTSFDGDRDSGGA
jgi:hypothetical protein